MFYRNLTTSIFIIGFLVLISSSIQAVVIDVPGNYAKIQEAINAASNGDTVLVSDGVYTGTNNVNLDFKGKAITIKSKNGPTNCIIDCGNIDGTRGFYFHNNETLNSVLDGFTIQNGLMDNGAGIHCYYASPTIKNNIIKSCSTIFYNGGGIYCTGTSSPKIINNTIIGNNAYYGGGLYCDSP